MISVTLAPQLAAPSQFYHRIYHPNLSCPQAERWKSAKTGKTITVHCGVMPNPTKFHNQHGRNSVGMSRKRWNDAVTTASQYNPRTPTVRSEPHPNMVVDRNFAESRIVLLLTSSAMALAVSHMNHRWRNDGRHRTGLRETAATSMAAAAGGVASNKGVSEGLSALGGKTIRVRLENAS